MATFEMTIMIRSDVTVLIEAERISDAIREIETGGFAAHKLSRYRKVGESETRISEVTSITRLSAEDLALYTSEPRREAKGRKRKGANHGDSDQTAGQ